MKKSAMSLKARIRNLAKEKNMPAQIILQNYMFERFLERLSLSSYRNNFVLKGGILVAALVGIENRSTMDMDVTIKNFPITNDALQKAIQEICNINLEDNVFFTFLEVNTIRNDDVYGGFRINLEAVFGTIKTPLSIDITSGDAITPQAVMFSYKKIFDENFIRVWTYNIETVLAEKVETILQRGELNTRPRDFYDVYILMKTQTFSASIFLEALKKTVEHRKTEYVLDDVETRISLLEKSDTLKDRWLLYSSNNSYAKEISFIDTIKALKDLVI